MAVKSLRCESECLQTKQARHGPRESPASALAELAVPAGVPMELLPAGWTLVCAPKWLGVLVRHKELLVAGRMNLALGGLADLSGSGLLDLLPLSVFLCLPIGDNLRS